MRETHRLDVVALEGLSERLSRLDFTTSLLVRERGMDIATIRLGRMEGAEHAVFIIRPAGCSPKQIREGIDQIELKATSLEKGVAIDWSGVGGYFGAGITIPLLGSNIVLPQIKLPALASVSSDTIDFASVHFGKRAGTSILSGSNELQISEWQSALGQGAMMIGIGGRSENQDLVGAIIPNDRECCLFVLDGNQPQGRYAVQLVSHLLLKGILAGERGSVATSKLPHEFDQMVKNDPSLSAYDMGSCAAVADISDQNVTFAHIGDSRVMLLRKDDQGIYQVQHRTTDHSLAQELRDSGIRDDEISPQWRHTITRNIKQVAEGKSPYPVECGRPLALRSNDLVLVFSDGLALLKEKELVSICQEMDQPNKIIDHCRLEMDNRVGIYAENGKRADNFSLAVFKFDPQNQL